MKTKSLKKLEKVGKYISRKRF